MNLHRTVERLGGVEALDRVAAPLGKLAKRVAPPKTRVKDMLSGSWLGHPLHPLLTDIPIGSFTSATLLDLIGGPSARRSADRLIDVGLAASVVTALAGAADWSDTYGEENRVGVVHAAANIAGVALYGLSAIARRRGHRRAATAYGLAGMSVMSAGGYLGGFLGYGRGVGVNNTFFQHAPTDWTAVLDEADLPLGEPRRVDADGAPVLLYRAHDRIVAISSRCTHAGGPLDEGEIDATACTVTCPWHQSEFRLDNGHVVHGPATVPQPAYDVRIHEDRIEVRAPE